MDPRRTIVALLLLGFLVACSAGGESPGTVAPAPDAPVAAEPDGRPNVFLIVIDTTRADRLSAYGYDRNTTPVLDRLAGEGVLYENAISSCSWTLPSHASLFTGLFPRDHHTTSENRTLDDSYSTLAELMRDGGYQTAGFSNNVWTKKTSGLQQGFETFEEMWLIAESRTKGIETDEITIDMGARQTNELIVEWLDGPRDAERPFFVFINYFEPHLPFRPTEPFHEAFLPADADSELVGELRSFRSPREYGFMLDVPGYELTEEKLEILSGLYDGEIAYVDSMIGKLMDELGRRGLLENTVFAITSDHGEHLGENRMLDHKFSVSDRLIRVPLILWRPGLLPSGLRVTSQVQNHDLFGTIVNLGGALETSVPGLPYEDTSLDHTFSELAFPRIFLKAITKRIPNADTTPLAAAMKAVRTPTHKYVWGSDGRRELYRIGGDPDESRNVAAEEPGVVRELGQVLERFNRGELP